MSNLTKNELEHLVHTLSDMHRQRCLLFGCVYGIPGHDEKPKEKCIYCGEPMPDRSDFWGAGNFDHIDLTPMWEFAKGRK